MHLSAPACFAMTPTTGRSSSGLASTVYSNVSASSDLVSTLFDTTEAMLMTRVQTCLLCIVPKHVPRWLKP